METTQQESRLVSVLREGITVIQMVLFKELKSSFTEKYSSEETGFPTLLAGAMINSLFGQNGSTAGSTGNPVTAFISGNRGLIEQELLCFTDEFAHLRDDITDALRVQVLCDSLTTGDSGALLQNADRLGILVKDREVPLPSTFITSVRILGERYGLTTAPHAETEETEEKEEQEKELLQ